MKLFLDQNLSQRLSDLLADIFPEIIYVRNVGLASAGDDEVWHYAIQNGLTIVSKDSDFRQRSFLDGQPPKVVWIRRGNCSTSEAETILRAHHQDLIAFDSDEMASFLALG